jgi:hypothetical protein
MSNLSLTKGRTKTIKFDVTGVDSWTGMLCKLYAVTRINDIFQFELDGAIDTGNNIISFDFLYDTFLDLVNNELAYEIVLYKSDKSYVKTIYSGFISVQTPKLIDPTL